MRWVYRLFVILCGGFLLFICGCHKADTATLAKDAVETIPVKIAVVSGQTVEEVLDYVADIKAQEEVLVYPKVPGKVIEKNKEEGSLVVKNETIMFLDRDEVGMVYEKAPVESPITGIIGKINIDIGAHVLPSTPVAMIVDMDKVKVYLEIPERYIPKVNVGMHAAVTVDAYPQDVFDGVIATISPVMDPLTRTANAQITIDNKDHRLRSGMFAKVKVVTAEYPDTLVVLKEAVMGKSPQQYVYIIDSGKAKLCDVEVGLRQGAYVQIKKGLAKGDKVVIMGQHRLFEGAPAIIEEETEKKG